MWNFKLRGVSMKNDILKMGTPNTLKEAFRRAVCIGSGKQITDEGHLIIQDFLAQKFGAAMIKESDQNAIRALEDLWKAVKDT